MRIVSCVLALLLAVSVSAQAVVKPGSRQAIENTIAALGMKVEQISPSPLQGLLEVQTDKGLFYLSEDGKLLLQGRLFRIDGGVEDLTEKSMMALRREGVARFEDSMIVFKAPEEKYVITVFTDISCGYCRRLHSQIDEYNRLGITVRYLAFPRNGLRSDVFRKMQSVWCASDPKAALTAAKNDKPIEQRNCSAPVAEHYQLGQKLGVTGTPAIVLANGMMIPGYKPPRQLLALLQNM